MNTKIIKFNLNQYKLYEKIKAKQGDTKSRFLLFQLFDGALPFSLENRSVRAYMIKPDSKEIFNDLIVNNRGLGCCTLELTNQVLAIPGTVKIELMVTEGDKRLTSTVFELEVYKSINSEKSIVSTNEFTALLNGLASLSEYDNYKNDVKEAKIKTDVLTTDVKNLESQMDTKVNEEDFIEQSKFNSFFMNIKPENLDNSKYIKDAFNAGVKTIFFPRSDHDYIFRTNIIVPNGVKLYSNGAKIKGGFIIEDSEDVLVEGFCFKNVNEGANEIAITVRNSNNVTIKDNILMSTRLFSECVDSSKLKILNNNFNGIYSHEREINVLTISGYEDILVQGNIFNCDSPRRFIKITSKVINGETPSVVLKGTSNLSIIGNIFKGKCDKQMIDCYSGVSNFIFSNNHVNVTDCTSVIEGKCDGLNEGGSGITTYTTKQNNIIISNNEILSNPVNFIVAFQGGYGLEFEKDYQKINIENNIFENVIEANTSIIDVRGFHSVNISQNNLYKIDRGFDTSDYSYAITAGSCKVANITNNNLANGCIRFSENLRTTTGLCYSKHIEIINVSNNCIDNVCALGGVYFESMANTSSPCYLISNNIIKSLRYKNPDSYAIYISDDCTFEKVLFISNLASFPTNTNRQNVRVGQSTVDVVSKNNTWSDSDAVAE